MNQEMDISIINLLPVEVYLALVSHKLELKFLSSLVVAVEDLTMAVVVVVVESSSHQAELLPQELIR
jgi:hypothetical protein